MALFLGVISLYHWLPADWHAKPFPFGTRMAISYERNPITRKPFYITPENPIHILSKNLYESIRKISCTFPSLDTCSKSKYHETRAPKKPVAPPFSLRRRNVLFFFEYSLIRVWRGFSSALPFLNDILIIWKYFPHETSQENLNKPHSLVFTSFSSFYLGNSPNHDEGQVSLKIDDAW